MSTLDDLARGIDARERAIPGLKPDNEARIVFVDDTRARRPLSVVYLHGFTASQAEGAPAHRDIARACDAHLYLARLHGHGSDDPEAMAGATPERWMADADEALDIGLDLGERVLLVGTSMGATLALDLAARRGASVAGVVTWSPGIRVHDPAQLEAALSLSGAIPADGERTDFQRRYWSQMIHSDGIRAVARLLAERMRRDILCEITCPVFMGLWDGGEGDRDTLTSVRAMRDAFGWLGTPGDRKSLQAYDHAAHVLASPERSPAARHVENDTLAFLRAMRIAR
ncbi:alpha/beta fold hydrolase [Luteibacter aegosomatis]|uniref:alpha/beta hydrolase n=1 Tax=Luteibacter aegosomatis TaxID=2911537 RepID=UPI001FF96AA0|nr:alpha/beta fold hydrolase [Luteibacter aegosomatis]UPG86468.1 alpha/beta fold hydrolase [Luteibacter aegosomatis]